MRCQNMMNPILMMVQCFIKVQYSTAGIAKQRIHPLLHQDLNNDLCSGKQHTITPFNEKIKAFASQKETKACSALRYHSNCHMKHVTTRT